MARIKTNVVDLLQMIADKEPPKTIMYSNRVWKLYEDNDYYNKELGIYLFDCFDDVHTLIDSLNEKVLIKVDE